MIARRGRGRALGRASVVLSACLLLGAIAASAAVRAVEGAVLVVSDLDRALDFYARVLPFEKLSERELAGAALERLEGVFGARVRAATIRLGEETLELREYLAPRGRAIPADSRSHDGWFQHVAIVVSDMERAYRHLRAHRVEHASSGPQRLPDWNPNAGGIEAFYFKDPDTHVLEIIRFPAGKGDPRWQAAGDRLFLGIDHTAIVVRDTDESLRFWRDRLGLRVAGESENHGTEQERLNQVFGARLRITALRAPRGPGVELLEYLAPGGGRPYPPDTRGNDLWSWQTRLIADDVEGEAAALRRGGYRWVSPGAQRPEGNGTEVPRQWVVRDPDGHAVVLVEGKAR